MHIYIHVPFCARRCSYCDFAIAVRRAVPSAEFTRCIAAELELRRRQDPWRSAPPADTLYFGGGTPSRLAPEEVASLVDLVRRDIGLAPDAEVTLEANPDDVTPARAQAWRAAGVSLAGSRLISSTRTSARSSGVIASSIRWMSPMSIGQADGQEA